MDVEANPGEQAVAGGEGRESRAGRNRVSATAAAGYLALEGIALKRGSSVWSGIE